ncbi:MULTISPECIES: excinuclease ABC subunit UvrB [Treponema]|uniref:UvrABC system protein B n=1 Tax=Treponema succinifaciens (strain ATCC 33096 / DSM 2489 / 6091) TaxID=869209 RepID=F2NW49_TRES6|nr:MULTISPECIES: excinuclease ABC subunit UvrB [Treponema]AEB14904.1 UvrABC system protein B [Treponema succinifaciens DSM 2489]MCI6913584.1 excinuclease ABC subunit B [Treponema succinifaciens]MDD6963267.1 excinuclease ABC subunit UvrB [Treponema succinifaciens]MDY2615405.1 excinuclease ABC subunit UvrB [Treponema succinifaciens]MDY5116935.1 excinuclease ABC subunit UvrB [Treponema succinifaciens]
MRKFHVVSPFEPSGDQPNAIKKLSEGFFRGDKYQTLKGVTGSGKTFTMAKIIEAVQRPTLIISHNKTLSAQLYREFKTFFPDNAVEYFVSYYDYYQPEAYVPARDLYIEKDASINKEIDKLRLAATYALMERRDVIIVATVSCIYGLGMPDLYKEMRIHVEKGNELDTHEIASRLISIQYERNDMILERGKFRIKGDTIEIFPPYMETDEAYKIELDFDQISRIKRFNAISGETIEELDELQLYPAKHFVVPRDQMASVTEKIQTELDSRLEELRSAGKILEAERLKTRTTYDLEMMKEMGYCSGIENYSGPISGRKRGDPPATLLHYFPDDFLCMIDEAHVSVPQIGAMYEGDRARKQNLIDFGFRLPSALDNRPLKIDEFTKKMNQVIFVTATPRPEEIKKSTQVVEQLIRPTGLLDPKIEVRPSEGQMQDIFKEVSARIKKGERSLILTLTKKMAEDLTDYLSELNLKVKYIHSEIDTFERVEILKSLRTGETDVLIGINLLREGIDLPEVSLIAILDADKIGFLRSTTSLIQIIGRAARNADGTVLMYADRMSDAMKEAIDETKRRRSIQEAYNKEHGIVPKTIKKAVEDILEHQKEDAEQEANIKLEALKNCTNLFVAKQRKKLLDLMKKEMSEAADRLDYEQAAVLRDQIIEIEKTYGK